LERLSERHAIDRRNLSPDRNSRSRAADRDSERLEPTADIQRRGFALDRGVHRENHLVHTRGAAPLFQTVDRQILRPDSVEGREVAEKGVDAVMVDFTVYPPHFEEPDPAIGTQFIRDVRAMLDEVGQAQDREIELIVELPCRNALQMGLDWRTWMREGLIDLYVPSAYFRMRSWRDNVALGHRVEDAMVCADSSGNCLSDTSYQERTRERM